MVAFLLAAVLVPIGAPDASADSEVSTVPGAEWTVESPASHGMDPVLLELAGAYAMADGRNTQGVVVVHQGAIVAEWFAADSNQDSMAASWSVAKSFTSALVGIAISEGLIPSVDEPMTTYFPDWVGTEREGITLRHVLHMESGLDWNESYDPADAADSDVIQMVATQHDQLAFAASRPAGVPPGTQFNYSSGDSMLLSGVIEVATGMSAAAYGKLKLLDPIGIDPVDWWEDAEASTLTYCCLDMSSRDFARFGLLYLNGGQWGSRQVVPADWVTNSIADTSTTTDGYGYQWWLRMDGATGLPPYYSARGHDGQYIYVIPSLDLVVVRNGFYSKSACPPIADPNLFTYYPSGGLVPGEGTIPPAMGWSDEAFLGPIVESVTGGTQSIADEASFSEPNAAQRAASPAASQAAVACQNQEEPETATSPDSLTSPATSPVPRASPAIPISSTPAYTG